MDTNYNSTLQEEPYLKRYEELLGRRHNIMEMLDRQMKILQDSYEEIDKKIADFGMRLS